MSVDDLLCDDTSSTSDHGNPPEPCSGGMTALSEGAERGCAHVTSTILNNGPRCHETGDMAEPILMNFHWTWPVGCMW